MTEKFSFEATPERGKVSALLLTPPKSKALLILAHGAGAGMEHANMESIASALAEKQIATFRFNFSYMEQGKGRESAKVSQDTFLAAVRFVEGLALGIPLYAGGHSYGGRMCSLLAAQHPDWSIQGLVFFAFPLHAPGKPGTDRAQHLPDIREPMLFLSGSRDTFMSLDLFHPVLEKLQSKAKLHLLDTATHGYKVLKRTRTNPLTVFEEMAEEVESFLNGQP
ncbi:MAG: alpha/beta fold hydrolase [Bacteroidota bacterium]